MFTDADFPARFPLTEKTLVSEEIEYPCTPCSNAVNSCPAGRFAVYVSPLIVAGSSWFVPFTMNLRTAFLFKRFEFAIFPETLAAGYLFILK